MAGGIVCGGTFAVTQFLVSNFLGPTLTDVAGGLISLAVLAVMLRFWQPRNLWQFPEETANSLSPGEGRGEGEHYPRFSTLTVPSSREREFERKSRLHSP